MAAKKRSRAKQPIVAPCYPLLEECSTLAYYNIDVSAVSAKSFYDEVVNTLAHLQLAPTICSVEWNNTPKRGWRKFPRLNNQLDKEGFENVTSIELLSLLPGGDNFLSPYYLCSLWSARMRIAIIVLCSSLRTKVDWRATAERLMINLKSNYGVGFRRDRSKGPCFYANGVGTYSGATKSAEQEEEDARVGRWFMADKSKVCREGIIWHVFEWNLLTEPQLLRPVNDLPLKVWIESDKTRGTLSPINDEVTLWEVKPNYQSRIFQTLYDADVIFKK